MNESEKPSFAREERIENAIAEYLEAVDRNSGFDTQAWLVRFDDIRSELMEFLSAEREIGGVLAPPPVPLVAPLDATVDMPTDIQWNQSPRKHSQGVPRSKVGGYQLKKLLGSGGMGHVYEATDPHGNLVAVKVLSQQWMQSSESLRRFKLEGRIASTINHPRCVFVQAADEDQGMPYIVMELMTGKTLKDLSQEQGPLSVNKAVQVIMDVLDGLEEAHSYGMIHRDIKPGNCYLESNGRVKLGDFGLARSVDETSDLTRTGEFVGTPLFASPEQVKGHTVDARTDIYSVCATLYFMLAGQAPFAGTSPTSVIAKIVSEDPTPIRELNPQVPLLLERILVRGLQRDPKARYQSVAELKQALEPFVTGRQALAAWGRRFAAYCLDSTLTGILSGICMQFVSIEDPKAALPLLTYLVIVLPVLVYHFAFEGLGRASPGKMLLRLQIADRRTGERPRRGRMVLRTLIAIMLMGVATDIVLYATLSTSSVANWFTLQWTGYAISYFLIVLPVLVARRYRLLFHDWLSGTMVIDRLQNSRRHQLEGTAAEYQIPMLAPTAYPAKVGDYTVKGLVFSNHKESVLSAVDERLGRSVWIWFRPATDPELSIARRRCDRSTRLRWLANGNEGGRRWDAFLATRGAPLKHWTTPESPMPWRVSRNILQQMVEELEQNELEGYPLQVGSLDQVWLDGRGRMVLLDWAETEPAPTNNLQETPSQRTQWLLAEAARLTLSGKSLPISGMHPPIQALVPLHVREILTALTRPAKDSEEPFRVSEFRNSLAASVHQKTEPSFESRLLGLGIFLMPALLILGAMASLSRLGNQLLLDKTSDMLIVPVAVDWLLEGDHLKDYTANIKATDFPTRSELEGWQKRSTDRIDRWQAEYSVRYSGLGSISKIIADSTDLIQDPFTQLKKVSIELQKGALVAKDWKKEGMSQPLDNHLFSKVVRSPVNASPRDFLRRDPISLIGISIIPFAACIVWGGMTRGGLSMWLSGLRVVDKEGRPISFWLQFVRLLIAGGPFVLLQVFITWNDLYHPDFLWMSSIAYQVIYWLALIYAILIVAFPRRAPHDWLLGTYLVTK